MTIFAIEIVQAQFSESEKRCANEIFKSRDIFKIEIKVLTLKNYLQDWKQVVKHSSLRWMRRVFMFIHVAIPPLSRRSPKQRFSSVQNASFIIASKKRWKKNAFKINFLALCAFRLSSEMSTFLLRCASKIYNFNTFAICDDFGLLSRCLRVWVFFRTRFWMEKNRKVNGLFASVTPKNFALCW